MEIRKTLVVVIMYGATSLGLSKADSTSSSSWSTVVNLPNDNPVTVNNILLPRSVVGQAQALLKEDIKTCRVLSYDRPLYNQNKIVWIYNKSHESVVYWAKPDSWIRLNEPQGLPALSKIFNLNAQQWENSLSTFMHDFVCIYTGYSGIALSKSYCAISDTPMMTEEQRKNAKVNAPPGVNLYQRQWEMNFGDDPGIVEKLRSLCGEKFTTNGNNITLEVNVLLSSGAITHWTVSAIVINDQVTFKRVSIGEVTPEGTFKYPIYGDFSWATNYDAPKK